LSSKAILGQRRVLSRQRACRSRIRPRSDRFGLRSCLVSIAQREFALRQHESINRSAAEGDRVAKARTPGWLRVAVIAPSLALYVVACLLPAAAFSVASNDSESGGLGLLVFGWMDGPQACLPWSSNFLWLAAVVLVAVGRPGWAWVFAAVGLLFASRVLFPYPGAALLEAKYWWLGSYVALAAGCGPASVRAWVVSPPPEAPDAVPGTALSDSGPSA